MSRHPPGHGMDGVADANSAPSRRSASLRVACWAWATASPARHDDDLPSVGEHHRGIVGRDLADDVRPEPDGWASRGCRAGS